MWGLFFHRIPGIKQFISIKAKSSGNFLQRQQTWIALDAKLIKLKHLLPDPAPLGSLLLSPAALLSKRPDSFLKSL